MMILVKLSTLTLIGRSKTSLNIYMISVHTSQSKILLMAYTLANGATSRRH